MSKNLFNTSLLVVLLAGGLQIKPASLVTPWYHVVLYPADFTSVGVVGAILILMAMHITAKPSPDLQFAVLTSGVVAGLGAGLLLANNLALWASSGRLLASIASVCLAALAIHRTPRTVSLFLVAAGVIAGTAAIDVGGIARNGYAAQGFTETVTTVSSDIVF
jgi:hypothetical protein